MMDSRGNEVEDAGNIELTAIEETDTESRISSIVNEESYENRLQAEEKIDFRCILAKTIVWKIFKIIVFLICLIFVVKESVEFYNIYSEYPTNLVQELVVSNKVKTPAVTICFKNT
ncbi:hypothetical protein AVEN_83733-1 [Araneus ventricosus]|uniref:Uncharacterized protein n=1 Tax=Araneus ventricosus TaxID=182803 RepID=A0A4Y2EY05_ARAVE|nr:hypothetical protein AVEN_83733-1 [Araneus ventricosus]